jgi:hypothetical protein
MLTLPALSAECERVFSSAKLLITASRNRLYPDIIEANECLGAWFGKPEKSEEKVERGGPGPPGFYDRGDGGWGGGGESSNESGDESGDEESDQEREESDEKSNEESDENKQECYVS